VAINSSQADTAGPGQAAKLPLEVAVIGSARLSPPDPRCALATETGQAIAAQGWIMITGGYGGLMEVASRAAAEAGGRVIGLPMRGWDQLTPNEWNYELRWCASYPERLAQFLAADAVVVLDGGIGTLSEAAIVWAALQTEPEAASLVFLGTGWQPVLDAVAANLVVDDRDLAHVTVCPDPASAIAHIARTPARQRRSAAPLG
jgi:uncharacterized protein (TIGR00725 family)